MAKSNMSGDSYTDDELSDPVPPPRIHRAMLGEVDNSLLPEDGTDSSEFSENELPSGTISAPTPQEPAQTTENPSNQSGRKGTSSARSTDGNGRKTGRRRSGRQQSSEFEDFE